MIVGGEVRVLLISEFSPNRIEWLIIIRPKWVVVSSHHTAEADRFETVEPAGVILALIHERGVDPKAAIFVSRSTLHSRILASNCNRDAGMAL